MISFGSIILFLAIGGLLFYMVKRGGGCCGGHGHDHGNHASKGPETKKDPVCGMEVSEDTELTHKHDGAIYYFCSSHCLEQFGKNTKAYLGDAASAKQNHG